MPHIQNTSFIQNSYDVIVAPEVCESLNGVSLIGYEGHVWENDEITGFSKTAYEAHFSCVNSSTLEINSSILKDWSSRCSVTHCKAQEKEKMVDFLANDPIFLFINSLR